MFKFLVWHVLLVVASCELYKEESGYILNYAPVYNTYKPRDYQFNYAVSDPHTGDHKSQWEVKTNGVVRGGYSLLEPDGTTRIVEYIADDDGFRAVVNKVGTAIHPVATLVPQVAPVSHYRTYDGQVANYIPQLQAVPQIEHNLGNQGLVSFNQGGTQNVVLDQSHAHALTVPQTGHNLENQGLINLNQGVVLDQSSIQGLSTPQIAHNLEDQRLVNLYQGGTEGELLDQSNGNVGQEQRLSNLGAVQSSAGYNIDVGTTQESVPIQGQNIEGARVIQQVPADEYNNAYFQQSAREEVPLQHAEIVPQNIHNVGLGKLDTIQFLQGQELRRPEVVPDLQGQSLAPFPVQRNYINLGHNSEVPLLQGHNLQVVPNIREDNLGVLSVGRGNVSPLQGQLTRLHPSLEQSRVVHENIRGPNFDGRSHELPQPQIEIVGSRGVPQAPGLVPVDPSYQTVIDYQGLGNDNRLKKDVYHSSYSEKVLKVVPAPRKPAKKVKKEFLIVYPESH